MLIVVSPAKKLNIGQAGTVAATTPRFLKDAQALIETVKDLSQQDLQKLMRISEALAKINHDRFANFDDLPETPAVFSFAGDTYKGLEATTLDSDELGWAQDHLHILSGLYGLLRPMDAMRPYRLEMGSRLHTARGKNLYEFWSTKIANALNEQAKIIGTNILVNCASQEYFGAVDQDILKTHVITPVFYEQKNGENKIVSFYAKRARGAMARYIIERRLIDPKGLTDFDSGGYAFRPDLSDDATYAFVRAG